MVEGGDAGDHVVGGLGEVVGQEVADQVRDVGGALPSGQADALGVDVDPGHVGHPGTEDPGPGGSRRARLGGDIVSYHSEVIVTDILIRDVSDQVLAAIDAKAKRVGLSRTAYLRRALERESTHSSEPITVDHLQRLSKLATELTDPDVMTDAWS